MMNVISQSTTPDRLMRAAGGFAIVSGIISAIGVLFLIAMFIFFATSRQSLGETFGMINDICVAIQYLLTIPIALAMDQILRPNNPTLVRFATIFGIFMIFRKIS